MIRPRQRLGPVEEKIIEFEPRLPPNLDGIFKAGSRNQSRPRAFAFEQSIGADGRPVQQNQVSRRIDLFQRIKDRQRGIARRRENFHHAQTPALDPHAIRERSPRIDGDAQRLGAARHKVKFGKLG